MILLIFILGWDICHIRVTNRGFVDFQNSSNVGIVVREYGCVSNAKVVVFVYNPKGSFLILPKVVVERRRRNDRLPLLRGNSFVLLSCLYTSIHMSCVSRVCCTMAYPPKIVIEEKNIV